MGEAALVKRSQFRIVKKVYCRQLKRERGITLEARQCISRGKSFEELPTKEKSNLTCTNYSKGGYQP